ncbi:MAG: aconitate hydratase [Bacteroidia bacterium]|nr:aconitate hydratase [Bacteroidia bacterium]
MVQDVEMIRHHYETFGARVKSAKAALARPLTLSEKIFFAHMPEPSGPEIPRGQYAAFLPDRVAMQDATAQMAVLQFMNAGKDRVCVPATIHCDHLICASDGAEKDLALANQVNREVYSFLSSAASRYGMGFWQPGAGIIHQVVLENYAFPGGMMIGTDSHTPNAGGLGMAAIGVGGADAVDVLTGMDWELKVPNIIGVRLTGELKGWASPKDIILKLLGILTVKGGTNSVIEYFGEGTKSISCTGKASICNMGAELGATCSIFPFDGKMVQYLKATGRSQVAAMAVMNEEFLRADDEVLAEPEKYYDKVIDINLSELEPYVNGPFTPDAACPLSEMKQRVAANAYPEKVEVCLIGSCTNSSYQDLARAAAVAKEAMALGMTPKASIIVNPGSVRVKETAERDGILDILREAGAVVMANACGPCIGQWKRKTDDPLRANSIVTSFNRNFAKRADGNPNTHAFIVSPELAVAIAFSGSFEIPEGLSAPVAEVLPMKGFVEGEDGYCAPANGSPDPEIDPKSERIQRLQPFEAWDGKDLAGLPLLIKTAGKCTTDHISMAGSWLRFRGHLKNISNNFLLGATDAFTGRTAELVSTGASEPAPVSASSVAVKALEFKADGGSIVVAESNYGEGSSREHAAMEPRFLGVKAIIAKSFARIHETNLKKQGVLALTFADPDDYAKVQQGDSISVLIGEGRFAPGKALEAVLHHKDGSEEVIALTHTYNDLQISWFKAGSALNAL